MDPSLEPVDELEHFKPFPASEIPPFLPTQMPSDLLSMLKGQKATMLARFKHRGIFFTRVTTHIGNSLIEFYPNGNRTADPTPGCIQYIFTQGQMTAFAVFRQLPAQLGTVDPYQHYPFIPAKLYSSNLSDHLEIVRLDWVVGHVARCRFSPHNVVILSLSNVSSTPSSFLLLFTGI
jgi:hypothetical protein